MTPLLLIKNGTIVTLGENNRVLKNCDLLIGNNRIEQIGEHLSAPQSKTIDAAGKIVMPGFINAHMHFYSTFVRGLGKAQPAHDFRQVLQNLWWRLDKQLNADDIYYSALLMLIAAIRQGTTTLIDHHASPGYVRGSLMQIARAVRESGLRASLCYEVSDRDGAEIARQGLEENSQFIRYCQTQNDTLLRAMFGLHASFTVSDATLDRAATLCSELDSAFHIHMAEAESDQTETKRKHNLSVVERLHKHGILSPNALAVHGVHIGEAEMEVLAESGTAVVHNPQSNMNNAVGIADITAMQRKGILVGLGSDAMTVNMFEELRAALFAQHLLHGDPAVGFMETINTLFVNNGRIANRYWTPLTGIIEEGAAADVVLIDYDPPTPFNSETIWGHMLFGIHLQPVDTTIVNGKVLMQNKQLQIGVDEQEIAARSRELTEALWKRF